MEELFSDISEISDFIEGRNPLKNIVKIICDYNTTEPLIILKEGENKKVVKDIANRYYYPFLWAKEEVLKNLFKGDRELLKANLKSYGLTIKKLRIENDNGQIVERLDNGYKYLVQAIKPLNFTKFQKFFTDGGYPIYEKEGKKSKRKNKDKVEIKNPYIVVSPLEQYMIQSGLRYFKGYESYDELLIMSFDIETEGLQCERHRINQIGIKTNKGYSRILYSNKGSDELENLREEYKMIMTFLKIIFTIKPDVLCGYNSENFDWTFIEGRLKVMGLDLKKESKKVLPHGVWKKTKTKVLKLGGEVEDYYPTVMPYYTLTDTYFAVRRAMAIDSSIKSSGLKYITKHSNLNKENRVYIEGGNINKLWQDNEYNYFLNRKNGKWVHKDNFNGKLKEGFIYSLDDEEWENVKGTDIVTEYLLDDLDETLKVEEQYNASNFLVGKMLPMDFEKVTTMGTANIWSKLCLAYSYEKGVAVPYTLPRRSFVGGISRIIKTGKVGRQVKLDFNSLYPSIMCTFNLQTEVDVENFMLKMLEYSLLNREKYKQLKKKAEIKIEKLLEEKNTDNNEEYKKELANAKKDKFINNIKQLPLKVVANAFFGSLGSGEVFPFSDSDVAENVTLIGRMMLRLMVHWFGKRGYNVIVGDTDGMNFEVPSEDTLTYNKVPYIGKGLSRETKVGKEYYGVEGDVAEFNDLYMRKYNGLGIDEYISSSLNLSRKNYIDLMPDGSMKFVGNTVKSKKMPKYIENFLDKGVPLLLQDKGLEFLNLYYDYVEKIYNYQIPLNEIASIGKIKISLDEYIKGTKELNKAGRKKSRQAWYELAIKDNVNVNGGDNIYYINVGEKKTSSDVQRVDKYFKIIDGVKTDVTKDINKEYKKYQKETLKENLLTKEEFIAKKLKDIIIEEEIIFNCVRIPSEYFDEGKKGYENKDITYNSQKYIDSFNKRIMPLLVVFDKSIRMALNEKGKEVNNILIDNPKDRKYFTEEETVLINGQPFNESGQDKIEAIMELEDREIDYWVRMNKKPNFIDDIEQNWEDIVSDYILRKNKNSLGEDKIIYDEYQEVVSKLTNEEIDKFKDDFILPNKLKNIVEIKDGYKLVSLKNNNILGTIYEISENYIIDSEFEEEDSEIDN